MGEWGEVPHCQSQCNCSGFIVSWKQLTDCPVTYSASSSSSPPTPCSSINMIIIHENVGERDEMQLVHQQKDIQWGISWLNDLHPRLLHIIIIHSGCLKNNKASNKCECFLLILSLGCTMQNKLQGCTCWLWGHDGVGMRWNRRMMTAILVAIKTFYTKKFA